jgi:hypothetical protein
MLKSGRNRGGGNKLLFVGILVIVVVIIAYVSLVKEGMTTIHIVSNPDVKGRMGSKSNDDKRISITDSLFILYTEYNKNDNYTYLKFFNTLNPSNIICPDSFLNNEGKKVILKDGRSIKGIEKISDDGENILFSKNKVRYNIDIMNCKITNKNNPKKNVESL